MPYTNVVVVSFLAYIVYTSLAILTLMLQLYFYIRTLQGGGVNYPHVGLFQVSCHLHVEIQYSSNGYTHVFVDKVFNGPHANLHW